MLSLKRKNENKLIAQLNQRNIKRKIILENNNSNTSHPEIYEKFIDKSNNDVIGFLFSKGNKLLVKIYTVTSNEDKSYVIFYAIKYNRWYGLNHLGKSIFFIKGRMKSYEQPFMIKIDIFCENGEKFNFTFVRTTFKIKEWYKLNNALDVYKVYETFPKYFKYEALADEVYFGVNEQGIFLWRINDNASLFFPDLWEKMITMISWSGMEYLNNIIS